MIRFFPLTILEQSAVVVVIFAVASACTRLYSCGVVSYLNLVQQTYADEEN